MNPMVTDRKNLLQIAAASLKALQSGAAGGGLESVESPSPETAAISNGLAAALDWARMEEKASLAAEAAGLESVAAPAVQEPYIPPNQVLSLMQSAYEEYLDQQAEGGLEVPFDTSDPGWLGIAVQKLGALLRGNHKFLAHTSLTSFQYDLPSDAVVALYSDWGTGEPTAQRVMQQIRKANPTHAIHLGDVYYSGTPGEMQKRFLGVIDQFGPPASSCKFFALNANHDMYSGGYGFFDTVLKKFGQEASYFNLTNKDWQLIGLDSAYEEYGLKDPQSEWLSAQLDRPGRAILMSHHQLFSAYETAATGRDLSTKVTPLLNKVFGWFWGHEHKCVVFGDHLGIKARCIGHGAIPAPVPYGDPSQKDVPVLKVDERKSQDGGGCIHGFALLRFQGPQLTVSYIDEFGVEFFSETLGGSAMHSGATD
jgi:hypothetical protein